MAGNNLTIEFVWEKEQGNSVRQSWGRTEKANWEFGCIPSPIKFM
jgi:hypothetical protein